MKVREILEKINSLAPFCLAEDWDNVGLMAGDPRLDVTRLGVALDPLPEALEEAFSKGCQALLSHHPLFFGTVRNVDFSAGSGEVVRMAAKRDMAVLAAHTNWDSAESGVSRILAEKLKMKSIVPLQPSEKGPGGLGALGELSEPLSARFLMEEIKKAWGLTRLDYYGDADCRISRVALCGGSGGGLWGRALAGGADLYATADMKYHDILDASRAALPVAVVDHAEMESVSLCGLARALEVPGELETVLLDYRGLNTPWRI